jgi:hypothetical protein
MTVSGKLQKRRLASFKKVYWQARVKASDLTIWGFFDGA